MTGFSPLELIYNQKSHLYRFDDDSAASPEKIAQRKLVFERLRSAKEI